MKNRRYKTEEKCAAGTDFKGKPVRGYKAGKFSRPMHKESMKKNEHKS